MIDTVKNLKNYNTCRNAKTEENLFKGGSLRGEIRMTDKAMYYVSKEDLNLLLHYCGELYNTGTHMIYKFEKDHIGQTDNELIARGAEAIMDKNYQNAYRLINRICPDDKIDGEIE